MSPPSPAKVNMSRTKRIVLLIDLHPLINPNPNPNPKSYLSAITSTASRLLLLHSPPPLSAFKFFSSAGFLPRHLSAPSVSFEVPRHTLDSLSSALNSICALPDLSNSTSCCSPRASFAASSLLQLLHGYSWETETEAEKGNVLGKGDSGGVDFVNISSNLVVLLSPVSCSVNCVADYLEGCVFSEAFGVVREGFGVRDVHLCWVDVRIRDLQTGGVDEGKSECGDKLVLLRDGIRKMGWGFCSSDLIVLGSALLPLGLIYPFIGVPSDFVEFGGLDKRKYNGQLSLEILDVNGMPLECKCCDLEFVNLKSSPDTRPKDISHSQSSQGQDTILEGLGKGGLKLHVKALCGCSEYEAIGDSTVTFLVRECFQEMGKNRKKGDGDFFAYRVIEMLHEEMGGVTYRSQIPTLQILLSFLHMKARWALVSILSGGGDTFMGVLKPFTPHSAILSVIDASHVAVKDNCGDKLPNGDCQTHSTCDDDLNDSNRCLGSQTETSTSGNCEPNGNTKRIMSQRHLFKDMTWSSFCKAAYGGSSFDLFEVYTAKYLVKSKKLKFLKCWIKQISKGDPYCLTSLPRFMTVDKLSACDALSSEPSPAAEEAVPVSNSETSESFFSNISKRIQHGLESGMDLQNLAERVVKSSIQWLRHKCKTENKSEDQQPAKNSDDSCIEDVGDKLIGLLLRASKEMKKIHEDPDPCSSAQNIVREYEFQIFLRMEILRSDVSALMGKSRKQKLLKQICSMLEIIQYLVAGGVLGHVSLYDYTEQTIRARYGEELEDVMTKIYTEMDLLPFGDEDETPSLLLNSEDSNQSWRDKYDRNEKVEANNFNLSVSTEEESSRPPSFANESLNETGKDEHARILNEAHERRQRARRLAPFASRVQDLQRVWAPKQPKGTKHKFDSLPKNPKRKDKLGPGYSEVCETPMTGNKGACSTEKNKGEKHSVWKALFQDN